MQKLVGLDDIELNTSAADWQDVVIKSGTIFLNSGYVTREYVSAVVQTAKNLGSYIVVVPRLAMPRARSINGTIESGINIMTLPQSVEFGNEDNGPIYLLIGLMGNSDNLYLKTMQAITTVFRGDRMLGRIIVCDRREMAARILNDVEAGEQCYMLLRFVDAAWRAA